MMFKSTTYLLAVASLLGLINTQMAQYDSLINPTEGINALPEIGKSQDTHVFNLSVLVTSLCSI